MSSVASKRGLDNIRDQPEQRDVREAILDATEHLLAEHRFDQLSVADILSVARVSRASFYFYFDSKHAVLGELVRRAVNLARAVAQPWVEEDVESPGATRGTESGIINKLYNTSKHDRILIPPKELSH